MLVMAFAVATSLAMQEARKEEINPQFIFNLAFIVLLWGIVGARAMYVLEHSSLYLKDPREIIMLQHGGLSWFGGLLAASIAAVFYLKKIKVPPYDILDLVAPYVALAQAIGRVGCFLNGCCWGSTIFPVQLYSSALLLLIFVFLRFRQKQPHLRGEIFFAYLFLYSIKRFIIEFWRLDNPRLWLGLTLFQFISLAIFAFALVKLIRIFKPQRSR
jgi:phosphatidylglycerol:prolipoprotein diacylglycerol transferase